MKVPPFWPSDPEAWFLQLEHAFNISGISSDETRYSYVVANLEPRVFAAVRDTIANPPATAKYQGIKKAIVSRLATSTDQKIRQLLEREELGDRQPSQFLRDLRALGGTIITEELLKHIWLQRLPAASQAILATQKHEGLEKLGSIADAVVSAQTQQQVSETRLTPAPDAWQEAMQQLKSDFSALAAEVRRQSAQAGRPNSRDPENWRQRRNPAPEPAAGICFYHVTYGAAARRCRPPCTYPRAGNATGGR